MHLIPSFLYKRLNKNKKAVTSKTDEDRFFGISNSYITPTSSTDYLKAFELVQYIGKGVSIIAGDIAEREYQICDNNGEEVTDKKIELLLNKPNSTQNYYEFIYQIVEHLLLDGNFFVVPDILDELSKAIKLPSELIVVSPAETDIYALQNQIIRDDTIITSRIKKYVVKFDTNFFDLMPDQVMQGKYPSPYNNIRGMGLIRMNNKILNSARLSSLLTEKFLENGAMIDYMMIPEETLGQVEHERLKQQVQDRLAGFRNFFKLFIPPVKLKLEKASVTHEDINDTDRHKLTESDIANMIFNIPAARWGRSEQSKQNTTGDELKNYHDTVLPGYWRPVEAVINRIIKQYNPQLNYKLIKKKIVDQKEQSEISSTLRRDGSITGNEQREMNGVPVEEGNQYLNTFQIDSRLIDPEQPLFNVSDGEAKTVKSITCDTKAVPPADKQMFRFLKALNRSKSGMESKFRKVINQHYAGMEKRVLEGLEKSFTDLQSKAMDINDLFNIPLETEVAVKIGRKSFSSLLVVGLTQYNDFFDSKVDTTTKNPNLVLTVEMLNKNYVSRTLNTNREDLRQLLIKAIDDGEGIHETKGRIKEYFNVYTNPEEDWKAVRIARTEIGNAYDQAAKLSFIDLDVKQIQVIGCTDNHAEYDCDTDGSKGTHPVESIGALKFHPNHTGSIVPVLEKE